MKTSTPTLSVVGRSAFLLGVSLLTQGGRAGAGQAAQHAQPAQTTQPSGLPSQTTNAPFGTDDRSERNGMGSGSLASRERMERNRQSERQHRIVTETDRLLALAAQLKAEVDAGEKSAAAPDEIRKTEEIEKLARSVKERMKG